MLKNNIFFFLKKYWWWGILTALLIILHSNHLLNSDEGHTLNGAWNILNGKKIYVDFFEFFAPGSYYLLALWWKIFSVSYLSAKILSLIIILVGAIGLYHLARYFNIKQWTWLPPLLFILASSTWPTINHNVFVITMAIWSVYTFIHIFKDFTNKRMYLLSGFMVGLTSLFLQHKGIALAFVCIIFLVILLIKKIISIKYIWLFLVGACIPMLILFIFWKPSLIFYNLIEFPLKHYSETTFISLKMWFLITLISGILFFVLYKKERTNYDFLYFGSTQLFLLFSVLQLADWDHISLILFPAFVMVAMVLEKKSCPIFLKLYIACIVGVVVIAVVYNHIRLGLLFLRPDQSLYQTIKTHCPGSIYSGPFLPGLYFEFRKINNLPFSTLITNQNTPEQFTLAAELLKKNQPDCLFLNYKIVEKYGYNKNNPVDIFFMKNYYKYKNFGPNLEFYLK